MLELYQFEGCPYCRRVRETLQKLSLDYIIRTVPVSLSERERVLAVSGQPLVPVLVDPEKKQVLWDSHRICAYLEKEYGKG